MDTPTQHPSEQTAPEVGAPAPDFTVPDESGKWRSLSQELREGKPIGLFFMRGEW